MAEESKKNEIKDLTSTKDHFAMLMFGTAAGFIAKHFVEVGYENFVISRRASKSESAS